jgi:small ligand-binding sensory domain FIST
MVPPMPSQITWVNALSTRPSLEAAVDEAIAQAQSSLPHRADLGLVFISSAFASEYSRLMPLLAERLDVSVLVGCGGGGTVGTNPNGQARELEDEPALSLTLACLPDVKLHAFHLSGEDLPDLDDPPNAWSEAIGVSPEDRPHFVLFADPFTSKINDLLQGLDFAYPDSVKVGGLASGGMGAGGSSLFCGDRLYREGVVGLALSGRIELSAIVAQGCRPIGQPYRVTQGERNILLELEAQADAAGGGTSQKPLEVLRDLIQTLDESDRQLAQHSLFIGIARDEFKLNLEQGDFLIRNPIGVDPKVGAIAIGDRVRPGQRIQFHLRDANTSSEDLEMLLQRYQQQPPSEAPVAGALMFACLGRGTGLYGQPHFDSQLFNRYIGNVAIGGFFCNGEIGPVGTQTFLHGYTSVFAMFHAPQT